MIARRRQGQARANLACVSSPQPELPKVPLIPSPVYESRDRGDLVLFCGAGVSARAGRPLFEGLASKVESKFGPSSPLEQAAIEDRQFDQYLQLVEQGLDPEASSSTLREFVASLFAPKPDADTSIHRSILKIASARNGNVRLVTTNYDRHFEDAAKALNRNGIRSDQAPRFARPNRDRWGSIVHLHGAIDGGDLRDLVLTSGDFGRAYITERWAARFITELLENFDVLFLGYSADDVVMRYVLDAYAARPQRDRNIWAIAGRDAQSDAHWRERWQRRNVNVIPYDATAGHAGFGEALAEWEAIIESPSSRTAHLFNILGAGVPNLGVGNRRNQLAWLLGDPAGQGARRLLAESRLHAKREDFERFRPADWFDTFSGLGLFTQSARREANHSDAIMHAKTPLVGNSRDLLALGDRASAFADWMAELAADGTRHNGQRSNSEELLNWIQGVGREGAVHPEFADRIRRRVSRRGTELAPGLFQAWKLVLDSSINVSLSPRVSGSTCSDLCDALDSGQINGLTSRRLLDAFAPMAVFRRPMALQGQSLRDALGAEPPSLCTDYVRPEIVLRCRGHEAEVLLHRLASSKKRDVLLRNIALDVHRLLESALELLAHVVPDFGERQGHYYAQVGSLAESNRHHEWTLLADLTWHAGFELDKARDERAHRLYEAWLESPHVTQRRLALHAAALWENLGSQERLASLGDHTANWLDRDDIGAEVLAVLQHLKNEGVYIDGRREARRTELERRDAAARETARLVDNSGFIAPADPFDPASFSAEELASLMIRATDFTTRKGRTASQLEVLVQRGESRKLLDILKLAIKSYAPRASVRIAGAVVIDAFLDRAVRYLLAIAEHQKKSDQEVLVSTEELLGVWDELEPAAMNAERGAMDDSLREELSKALNHPAGKLAQALFAILLPKSVQHRSMLDTRLKLRIEHNLTSPGNTRPSAAERAFLAMAASRVYLLHFAEPDWTAEKLVPHFFWSDFDSSRARTCWQGYLWGPMLDQHLYARLKVPFLEAFNRRKDLPRFVENLCGLLVSLALDGGDVLQPAETKLAVRNMGPEMRRQAAWHLSKRVDDAESDAAEFARKRVLPWLNTWPLDQDVWRDGELVDELTQIALKCGDATGQAAEVLLQRPHAKLGRWQHSLGALLHDHKDLLKDHPIDISRLFDHVLPSKDEHLRKDREVWSESDLKGLVDQLREAGESVTNMPEFKRLEERLE